MTPTPLPVHPSFPSTANTRSVLKQRTLLFRYMAEINLILGAWYLAWRVGHSVNFSALWLAIPLLLAEIYSYVGGCLFTIGLWRPIERQVRSLDQLNPNLPEEQWPTVDVFITCYNEPVELVEQTVKAALAIDYPLPLLRVYVLDDGNSPEMRQMTQQEGLADLQSPALQAEAERINQERQTLMQQLEHIQGLTTDAAAAETWLEQLDGELSDRLEMRLLKSFKAIFNLLDPAHPKPPRSIQHRLNELAQKTERAIQKAEKQLSNLVRLRYIARPKEPGKPHHAKAGNINYALFSGETFGEFILTLDADHIPKPQFLKRTLSYFFTFNPYSGKYEPNRVALVQTPQDFYNLPSGDVFGHNAHLFYGPIQQGKDGLGAAFYTGTNAILRREALINVGLQYFSQAYARSASSLDEFNLIGGMSSASITEDMNTAMRLHSAGWQSLYHNELLAAGLAPDDLGSTFKQRLRWAQGTIQVLVQENPLTKPGLSFWQRLQYFQTMYSYFSGFATLVFIACPIIFFFTGIIPVSSYGPDFAIHFFPAFVINRVTFLTAVWGIPARELWRSEQYAIALFPLFIQSVWSVLTRSSIKFQVTPKQRQSGNYLRLVWPQLVVIGLTGAGIGWSLYRFTTGTLESPWVYLLNGGWAIYNICLLWPVVIAAVWQPKRTD